MKTFIAPRVRRPALYALAGIIFAAAWLVRGGPLWWVSIASAVATAVVVGRVYWLGGRGASEDVRAGAGPDEREWLISLRSRALACDVALAASFIGLENYGIAEQGPARQLVTKLK
jgi:hypothetical protein